MLYPYSLVDGVVSPITPLTTFSDESPASEEFVSTDVLQPYLERWTSVIVQMWVNILVTKATRKHTKNKQSTLAGSLPSNDPTRVGYWEG